LDQAFKQATVDLAAELTLKLLESGKGLIEAEPGEEDGNN
jgi:hypothetical protein